MILDNVLGSKIEAGSTFCTDGRHASDYSYFYNNIKENVSKRVEAYKTNQK